MRVMGTPHPGIEKWTKVHSPLLHAQWSAVSGAARPSSLYSVHSASGAETLYMILCLQDKIEHNIQLPSPIDPYSAKALITLHGLLYISVQRIS